MASRSLLAWALSAALAPALAGQGKSRQELIQAALNHQAVVSAEREGALVLRDLGRCGVAAPALEQLGEALTKAITAWVQAHPPREYGTFEANFTEILKLPEWVEALRQIAGPETEKALGTIEAERQRRLTAATGRFIRDLVACELRLAPAQVTALDGLCQRIAEQSVGVEQLRTRPTQVVRENDRRAARVLSDAQYDWAELLVARPAARDARVELALECERIRLLCQLDERRARLLRACGMSEGQKRVAAEAAAREAAAKKKAEEKKEEKKPEGPQAAMAARESRLVSGLPNDEHLDAPFWKKVRDTLLSAEEKALLVASPAVGPSALKESRVELTLARLDTLFRLDPTQLAALRPLAEKVVDDDWKSVRVASLDVARGFGLQARRQQTTPEERAAMQGLEGILDRAQFEVMKDKIGL